MASEHRVSGAGYFAAWIALLVLTALSYGAANLALGALATTVALAIAGIKALVVLLFFMHLIEASTSMRVIAAAAVLFIVFLCLGIAADVAYR
jgi:cytochrome c oxidase subunit IV